METILSFSTISIRTLSMAHLLIRITAFVDYRLESNLDFSATVVVASNCAIQLTGQVVDKLQAQGIRPFHREVIWETNSVIADHEVQIFIVSLRQVNSNFTIKRVG